MCIRDRKNLAPNPKFADKIAELKAKVPTKFTKYEGASVASLPKLKWNPLDGLGERSKSASASKPEGNEFNVVFTNEAGQPVKVFSINSEGEANPFGTLETAWSKPFKTRPGAVWMITDANALPLGYFTIGDRKAHAVIPASKP